MKIGITEAGDASLNYEWTAKADTVDGMILITKNITDKFIDEIMEVKDKTILHCSCTGYGGTVVEPNLPSYQEQIKQLHKLLSYGFDVKHVVLRIDPIIPSLKGLELVEKVLAYAKETIPDLERVRVSIMDVYPHVYKRFEQKGLADNLPYTNRKLSIGDFKSIDEVLNKFQKRYGVKMEACAEPNLPSVYQIGCVSKYDLDILNLDMDDTYELKKQRPTCLCIAPKQELLTYKYNQTGYNHCYGCLYCYWKTELD